MLKKSRLPILYSLRNCPYAIRARIAIYYAQQAVILRDVVLSDKPKAMLSASPKGTVPVLVLTEPKSQVIDESIEVMLWALSKTDPDDLLDKKDHNALVEMLEIITVFDDEFKACLDVYKCAKRYHETNIAQCRARCEVFIQQLEQRLHYHDFLMSVKPSLADIALLPLIRQFSRVERQWYLQSPYPKVRKWLDHFLQSPMFSKTMTKYPLWSDNEQLTNNEVIIGQRR